MAGANLIVSNNFGILKIRKHELKRDKIVQKEKYLCNSQYKFSKNFIGIPSIYK